jgi:hypothetical protein
VSDLLDPVSLFISFSYIRILLRPLIYLDLISHLVLSSKSGFFLSIPVFFVLSSEVLLEFFGSIVEVDPVIYGIFREFHRNKQFFFLFLFPTPSDLFW